LRELVTRFGSIFGAWRQALDLDGNGRLSFGELCIALRRLGYGGNVKELWHALDTDSDGFVMLDDLDPKVGEEITSYRKLVLEQYPNMLSVWCESLIGKGSEGDIGQINFSTFSKHCEAIGWSGDARSLFRNLVGDSSRRLMTLHDFDVQASHAMNRGDMEMISETKPETEILKMSFDERQEQCFSQRWSRMNAKIDRSELERKTTEYKSKDKASQCAESLRFQLKSRYGTLTAGWRHGLDVNGLGKVTFGQFCIAMRKLGFSGSIKNMFDGLDVQRKGSITLRELDPESDEIIKEFRTMLLEKHGTYIKGWKAMDTNGNGSLEIDEMEEACESFNYTKDPKQLFKLLLEGPGKKHITMADLDPTAMRAYWRGDTEGMSAMSAKDRGKADLAARFKADAALKESRMEAHDWATLKKSLIRKYGTVTAAWRSGLDVMGNGKVSFLEFSKQVRHAGFCGNINKTFQELDEDNSGIISFNEVDPGWYAKLSVFHAVLFAKHKSYQSAWKSLDADRSNAVDVKEIENLCHDLGYPHSPKELFKQLLASKQVRQLCGADLECIAPIVQGNHDDPNAALQMHKRDSSMLSEEDRAKISFSLREAKRAEMQGNRKDAFTWEDLKKLLIRKYGTITAAWRHGLDWSGNGKLSFTEFARACRDNAFHGNIEECFREVDNDASGVITFNEVDNEWFLKHRLFHDLLLKRYGCYQDAWKGLDANKNNMCELEEFEVVCKEIGYTESAEAHFRQLCKDQGRRFLTPEDFEVKQSLVARAAEALGRKETLEKDARDAKKAKEKAREREEARAEADLKARFAMLQQQSYE